MHVLPEKNCKNLIFSYVLEHCMFGTIFRVMVFKKIRDVLKWHVISIVLCQHFCGETALSLCEASILTKMSGYATKNKN